MLTYDLTADELMKQDPHTAIIPLASIEQHGPHLPVATDWYIASAIGQSLAEKTGFFLIPALPISTCREQMGKKGSVWMDPDIFYDMLTSILMSLKEQGFKRVITLQCHGGIFMMTPIIRQINASHNPSFMVANIDMCNIFDILAKEGIAQTDTELHAGEIETSMMLHIATDIVHMDLANDYVPTVPRSYLNYGSIFRASPSGVWGEPTKSTAAKGARMIERSVELSLKEAEEIFAFIEAKEKTGYSFF